MIYVTGDCHGDFRRFSSRRFRVQKHMDRNDLVIICGDFGVIWDKKACKEENWWLNWLESKPFTVAFVDGNHENFDRLYSDEFPVVDFMGGKARQIRENVLHLMRGYVYEIEGKKFWAFGGASSHDIRDGVLDRADFPSEKDFRITRNRWKKSGKEFRINHVSWWEKEIPSPAEMNFGSATLNVNNNEVDFIITHCAPQSVAAMLSNGTYEMDPLTSYFNVIDQTVRFRQWFFGHYHGDAQIIGKYTMLHRQIVRIA